MSYRLKIRVRKRDVPRGAVLVEDAASLSQGLYDSLVRLIQHELGYVVRTRPKEEARCLSRIALVGVSEGSGVLEYDPLPAQGARFPQPPAVVAATSLVQGVASYTHTGEWPGYLPAPARRHFGAAVGRVLEDSSSISMKLYHDGAVAASCKIDRKIKDSLQEPETFEVTEPVQLTGKIYDINMNSLVFKIDTSPQKVSAHFAQSQAEEVDDHRWERVTIKGYPKDFRCSAVERLTEIRQPEEGEDDGLVRPEEEGQIEETEAYRLSLERIEELRLLEDDWDSYKGTAPLKSTLDFALSFIRGLCRIFLSHDTDLPTPFVAPTRTGGVQLEWKIGKRELELEIPIADRFSYLWISGAEESEGPISRWDAIRRVWQLVSGQEG